MPSAVTWIDLEIIILSKGIRKWQISYDIAYMCNLKRYKWTYMQNRIRPTDTENKLSFQRAKVEERDTLGVWH